MAKCTCDICKLVRRFEKVIKPLPKSSQKWLEGFFGHYLDVAQDLEIKEICLKEYERRNGRIPFSECLREKDK